MTIQLVGSSYNKILVVPYRNVWIQSSQRYSLKIKLNANGNYISNRRLLENKHKSFSANISSSSSPSTVNIDENLLTNEYGWNVRRLNEKDFDEMKRVAYIQAEAFHVQFALFDDLFFQFFQAEVLSGLIYKLKNSAPDRYACLVAEASTGSKLVGIVDVTAMRDADVVQHLAGGQEYLYVSGLAVSKMFRRQKIASALLKACDVLSVIWGCQYLVLRAYEDDYGARTLYSQAGYRVVSADPPWFTSWIGRKRRVLMIKTNM
ncbi:hypothetical protein ACFE04_004458 [Oxalis oulophora]